MEKSTASGGLAKSSEPIRLQHSYHVTFFRNTVRNTARNASEMHPKFSEVIPTLSEMHPKYFMHSSRMHPACSLPHIGEGGWGREGALSKGSLSYNNAFQYDAYLTSSNTVKIPNLSQMYQKCIRNLSKIQIKTQYFFKISLPYALKLIKYQVSIVKSKFMEINLSKTLQNCCKWLH